MDANAGGCVVSTPVENIVYKRDGSEVEPPYGEYKVQLRFYRPHSGSDSSTYSLVVIMGDKVFSWIDRNIVYRGDRAEYWFNY